MEWYCTQIAVHAGISLVGKIGGVGPSRGGTEAGAGCRAGAGGVMVTVLWEEDVSNGEGQLTVVEATRDLP